MFSLPFAAIFTKDLSRRELYVYFCQSKTIFDKKYWMRERMPGTLTSRQRYLLENPKLLEEMTPQQRGAFYRDVRKKAATELNDIVFLAKTLPERQQAQIFSRENLILLFDALLSMKRELNEKDLKRRRGRLLQIFRLLFYKYICNTTYVLGLAKREREILSSARSFADDMQALYLASTHAE